jgi:hypothetical protein
MAYPTDVFNVADSPALIVPDKGEYFSVSRIREVKADFGPARTNRDFTSVEVFLLSTDQKLLVHQFLKAPEQPVAPVKAAKPKAEETPDTTGAGTETPDATSPSQAEPSAPAAAQPLTPPTDPAPQAPSTPPTTMTTPGATQ